MSARERAEALDAADPLGRWRDRFVVADPELVYFDGNSLGRLPIATRDRLSRVIDQEWGADLIRSWEHWIDLPTTVGDRIAASVLGARPGEVLVTDSTTVNFYRLASAALDARPGRPVIVTDVDNFPTDRYVVEGLAASRGLDVRWIRADPVEGPQPEDVAAVLGPDVALVTLSHVAYRSGAIADLAGITALAHDAGALALWDLSHSAGAVPVELEAGGADLAVGCTYKYLNGGPGAPAYLYVRTEHQAGLRPPIWGWWSQREMFEMGERYEPETGIRAFLVGTPGVLALNAVDEGVALVAEAGLDAIRAKSVALTAYAVELHDELLAPPGFSLVTPRDPRRRGSHVAIGHPRAAELCRALVGRGVVPDYRRPNVIRFGLSPLTTSFHDVWRGLTVLAELAGA